MDIPVTTRSLIALEDQAKTKFTYLYGTYSFNCMAFVLCDATATSQRRMMTIFYEMMEEFIEVFMDNFSIFGNSFQACLRNLGKVLARYEYTNLVLNWKMFHFLVRKGTVLGHKVTKSSLEVDKAKVEIIEKFPPPIL